MLVILRNLGKTGILCGQNAVFWMLKYAACSTGSRPALYLGLHRSHLTTTQAKQTNENMKAELSPRNGRNPLLKKH